MINDFDDADRERFPQPSSLVFKQYHIVNKERTMDGTLVVDYINSKEMIDVSWGVMTDEQFALLQNLFTTKKKGTDLRYSLSFVKAGQTEKQTINAYTEEISYYPFFQDDGKVVWCGVTVSFVQE